MHSCDLPFPFLLMPAPGLLTIAGVGFLAGGALTIRPLTAHKAFRGPVPTFSESAFLSSDRGKGAWRASGGPTSLPISKAIRSLPCSSRHRARNGNEGRNNFSRQTEKFDSAQWFSSVVAVVSHSVWPVSIQAL